MEYRTNRKTGDRFSEIGLGTAYLFEAGMEEGVKALQRAVEGFIRFTSGRSIHKASTGGLWIWTL